MIILPNILPLSSNALMRHQTPQHLHTVPLYNLAATETMEDLVWYIHVVVIHCDSGNWAAIYEHVAVIMTLIK